ncbi:diguanylate cyclase [Paenibacillus athensensis]|uniref:GGDEF domain-containing protein n=1 Tax=Paenibacillus athensensis TaxID=1967502 RepID=A0A4Y8Q767_9BACL|nr:diguanylate cyclase [Paenibacillus athensensis]MCD1259816.1 diguanylate cyclase [Paenibacillus athensensis]
MQWMQGYPFYMLIAAALGLFLCGYSYRYRHTPGRRFFWIIALLASTVMLATVFELMAGSFAWKLWWRNLQQGPLFFCALFTYATVTDFLGKSPVRMRRQLTLLSIPIVAYMLLIFTDPLHHWMRSSVGLTEMWQLSEIRVQPTLLNMIFIVYNQMFCVFAIFVLAVNLRNAPRHYYKRYVWLLVGLLMAVAPIFLLPVLPVRVLGATALSFVPSGLIMYYALFRYQLLSVWPIAKDKMFQSMKDGIVLTDPFDTIVDVNAAAERMLLVLSGEPAEAGEGSGGTPTALGQPIHRFLKGKLELAAAYRRRGETTLEVDLPNDVCYSAALTPVGRKANGPSAMLLMFSDISDKKRYERELMQQAAVDELTGLHNRRYFLRKVRERLKKISSAAALLLIDIDDFKTINDSYGHAAGDRVLTEFAGRLKAAYGGKGVIGRIGGEEFAVLLTGLDAEESLREAGRFLEQLQERSFTLDGQRQVTVTASIGAAPVGPGGNTFEELYQDADAALYMSKNNGKNKVTLNGE